LTDFMTSWMWTCSRISRLLHNMISAACIAPDWARYLRDVRIKRWSCNKSKCLKYRNQRSAQKWDGRS
jgi:hypothetical protein